MEIGFCCKMDAATRAVLPSPGEHRTLVREPAERGLDLLTAAR